MSVKATSLTTRQRAMDFMDIASLSTVKENVLDRIIDSVSDFIQNYCHRMFKKASYTEILDSDGSGSLDLKQYPVVDGSVTLYYRNSTENKDSWTTIDSEDYFVNLDAGIITLAGNAKFLRAGTQMYKVVYQGGYDFDNAATFLSTYAADLEYIVWKLVSTAFNKRKGEVGVQSERIGDYSVTYMKEVFENSEVKAILDKYQKVLIGGAATPVNF